MRDDGSWAALEAAEQKVLAGEDYEPPAPAPTLSSWRRAVRRLAKLVDRLRFPPEAPPPPPPRYPAPAWSRRPPARDRVGLALSGGGIRSATFNLGILQQLAKLKLLDGFDYLSTVSGGGYVGGFWSAWKARPDPRGPFPGTEPEEGRPEGKEIRHLREFGNFLQPRLQLLSVETGRLVAAFVGGVVPCVVIALTVVLLSVAAWLGLAWLLLGEGPTRGLLPALVFAAGTLAVHLVTELAWQRRSEPDHARATGRYVWGALASAALGGIAWFVLWQTALPPRLLLSPLGADDLGPGLSTALAPLAAWGLLIVLGLGLRGAIGRRYSRRTADRPNGRSLDRLLSRNVLCAALWGVVGLLWVIGQILAGSGIPGLLSALGTGTAGGGAFASLRRLLGLRADRPSGGKLSLRGQPWLLQALAYLTLGAMTSAMVALLVLLADRTGASGFLGAIAAAGLLLALALALFDPHEVGFHAFYRSRLVRAYLGASNPEAPARATSECAGDDLPLPCLPKRPLHLVCCAANDLVGDPLGGLHRGAESAVLSKLGFQVGDRWRPWAKDGERPTLGDAMTASAAAFNSHMGALSLRLGHAATFLLAALGLRLGLWVPSPRQPASPLLPFWRGQLFLRELLGLSSVESRWVHLSDGAHFENLAVYELVRRHCRFILLSDCASDADRAFDDFANLVRKVREDFGVEIDIDLEPLRPDADGRSEQPMVAGEIRYPPAAPEREADVGVLLYLKPTLTGAEPADVAQYAQRNERFPHESTLDQFYDEAQWESYRRLGEHVLAQAFDRLGVAGEEPSIDRLFLHARYQWAPLPVDAAIQRLDAAWAGLEERLEAPELAALRRQVVLEPAADATGGDGGEGGDGDDGSAREEPAMAALPAVRQAIHLMEAVFVETGLGRSSRAPSHRRYMGWLNRFGVWLSAPLVRDWWPWLAPFHSRDFVAFAEETFDLGWNLERDGAVRAVPGEVPGGYAFDRWRAAGRQVPDEGLYGFFVEIGSSRRPLHAALVRVETDREHPGRVVWRDEDFFVAPGLWGIRLGERFLDALLARLRGEGFGEIRVTSKRDSAVRDALYTGAEAPEGARFERQEEGGFLLRW